MLAGQGRVGGEIGYLFVEVWTAVCFDYVAYDYGKVCGSSCTATGCTISVRCYRRTWRHAALKALLLPST